MGGEGEIRKGEGERELPSGSVTWSLFTLADWRVESQSCIIKSWWWVLCSGLQTTSLKITDLLNRCRWKVCVYLCVFNETTGVTGHFLLCLISQLIQTCLGKSSACNKICSISFEHLIQGKLQSWHIAAQPLLFPFLQLTFNKVVMNFCEYICFVPFKAAA